MSRPKKILSTIGYNHVEPGDPKNTKTFRICGALTRNIETIHQYCQNPAGKRTSHVGAGRCYLHAGSSPYKPNRYSHLWRGRVADLVRQRMDISDDDPLDLLPELQVQQTILSILLDRLNSDDPGKARDTDTPGMATAREYYVKSGGTSHDNDTQSPNTVAGGGGGSNDNNMVPMVNPFAEFLSTEVGSSDELGTEGKGGKAITIDAGLVDQIRLATQDIVTTVTRVIAMRNQTAMTKAEVMWMLMTMKEVMVKYVPKEKQAVFVKELMGKIPHPRVMEEVKDEEG